MANEVRIVVTAQDKTKGTFTNVKSGLAAVTKGALVMGTVMAAGALKAVKGASDLSETINKSNVIFGKNAKAMDAWAKKAANNLGLSRQEALEAAAGFGDMFLQLGFASNKADDMARSVVKLSADLGSFNNLPTADVSERIAAAFRGEYDSLQALVPTINAAKVEKQALATTGKESAKQLTAEDKAAAVLKITMDSTKRAQGDFKKTQDGLANSLKIVTSRLKDARDRIGKLIEPVARKAIQWFIDTGLPALENFISRLTKDKQLKASLKGFADAFGAISDKDFAGTLDAIADSLPAIVDGVSDTVTWIDKLYDAIVKFDDATAPGGEADLGAGPAKALDKLDAKITKSVAHFRGTLVAGVKRMWGEARTSFVENHAKIAADVAGWVSRVITRFANLKARAVNWVTRMWGDARASFVRNHASIAADVSRFVQRVITFFANLRNRVTSTATSMMSTVRNGISRGLSAVRGAFSSAVGAISTIWNRIRAIARTPVAFVVNTILNGGLLAAVRAISKFVGYGPGKNIRVSMARGGMLPGYTPGRDVHRFYSATGGILDLSGGEAVAVPQLARAIGRKRWDAANQAARNGRVDEGMHYLGGFAQGTSGIAATKAYARSIGLGSGGTYPGHGELGSNLSWDFMTSSRAKGEQLANWAWANARAIHLWYEIYWRRIRSMTRPGAGWTPYGRSNPHTDHVHLSFYRAALGGLGGGLVGAGAGIGGGGFLDPGKYLNMVTSAMAKLKGIKNTPYGSMVAGVATKIVGAIKDKISSLASSFVGAAGSKLGGVFTALAGGSNRSIGHRMMLQRWGESQWPPLNSLWTRESGWRTTARNPSSGAYGIPQSLPASKMASAGADWRTNPATQIKWGLGYIAGRYGNPAGAWAHSQRTGWYDRGGILPPGLTLAYNGTGRNEMVIPTRSGGGVGNTYIINAPNYVGDKRDLVKALTDLNRTGRLEVVRR